MKKKVFYGWVVVFSGVCIISVANGIISNCFSLFVKTVCEDTGFSRQGFSVCLTLYSVMYMLVAFFWGKICRHFKMRVLMRLSILILPVVYFLYSRVDSLPLFYLLSLAVGICQSLLGFLPFSVIITNWFEKKRGLAMGITFMGSGVGGMLFNPIAGGWIEALGWRSTYQLLAGVIALIGIPVIYLLVKEHPGQMNLEPYGHEKTEKLCPEMGTLPGVMLEDARKTPVFWLLILALLLNNYALNSLNTTIAPYLGDLGYTTKTCAAIMSVYMGCLAIGKISLGRMYDKLGTVASSNIANAALCIGLVALWLGGQSWAIPFIVLGAGLGCSFGSVAYPELTLTLFGIRDYPSIYGILSAVSSLTSALSPVLNGAICDRTGSYASAILLALALALIAFPLFPLCIHLQKRRETIEIAQRPEG